jgi:hypothetical protein
MRQSRKFTHKIIKAKRRRNLGLRLLPAILLYAMTGFDASALEFKGSSSVTLGL